MKDYLLDLSEFIIFGHIQVNELDIIIQVEKKSTPSYCPHCGSLPNLYKYGQRKQIVLDLPIRIKRVGLEIKRKRYKCRECNSTFWEVLESVDQKRKMTKRLVKTIERQSLSNTFVEVAKSVGVDEKTVRNIFKDYVQRKEQAY